jgi:hypothetical protein
VRGDSDTPGQLGNACQNTVLSVRSTTMDQTIDLSVINSRHWAASAKERAPLHNTNPIWSREMNGVYRLRVESGKVSESLKKTAPIQSINALQSFHINRSNERGDVVENYYLE